MKVHSTFIQSRNEGSTARVSSDRDATTQAELIKSQWELEDGSRLADRLRDQELLRRHKSLILDLVLDDCTKLGSNHAADPLALSARYRGLGDSLEHSIMRQLEVQAYLVDHPDLVDSTLHVSWPNPGENYQGFQVVEELGRGAIARVFLCRQQELGGRLVVVKVSFGQAPLEASLLGQLRHPGIVPVLSASVTDQDEASLLCMPFLGRSTLNDLLDVAFRDGLPENAKCISEASTLWLTESDQPYHDTSEAISTTINKLSYVDGIAHLARQLGEGLKHAHQKNILHGDIKPSNVLLSFSGAPLLFDFNLGREVSDVEGPNGGTLPYMAPEQLRCLASSNRGSVPVSSRASDIYAFGALLYELLTGKPPFPPAGEHKVDTATQARKMLIKQRRGCILTSKVNPSVNRSFAHLISDCMAFKPEDRPASMSEVLLRLRHETSTATVAQRKLKENKYTTIAASALLAIAIVSAFLVTWSGPNSAERTLAAAHAALSEGDPKASIALVDQLIDADEEQEQARVFRAHCYLQQANLPAANRDLEYLVNRRNNQVAAAVGYYFSLRGKHEAALTWYERAISRGDASAAVWNNIAIILLQSEPISHPAGSRLERAVAAISEALLLAPDSAVIHRNAVHVLKASLSEGYRPSLELRQATVDWISKNLPDDGEMHGYCFEVMLTIIEDDNQVELMDLAMEHLVQARSKGYGPLPRELSYKLQYEVLRKSSSFAELLERLEAIVPASPVSLDSSAGTLIQPELVLPLRHG